MASPTDGEGWVLEKRYRLPIVVFGVPVPGKANPYLVAVTTGEVVWAAVDIGEAEGAPSLRLEGEPWLGWRLELPLKSLVDAVSARLEQPIEAVLRYRVEGVSAPPSPSLYAVLSAALVEAVSAAAGYPLEPGEVLEAAQGLDAEAGVDLDYVAALREAGVRGRPLVWRRGEETVELGLGRREELELVGEETVGRELFEELGERLQVEVTRMAGLTVVEAVARLREGTGLRGLLETLGRVENSLYYLLYSLSPPEPQGCKWGPGLNSAHALCPGGTGAGDGVWVEL